MTDTKKVEIYTTPTCQYCKAAKEFFKENNITYKEYNVAEDLNKRQEMIEKTGQMGVPVIVFDGEQAVVGFDQGKVADMLGVES